MFLLSLHLNLRKIGDQKGPIFWGVSKCLSKEFDRLYTAIRLAEVYSVATKHYLTNDVMWFIKSNLVVVHSNSPTRGEFGSDN